MVRACNALAIPDVVHVGERAPRRLLPHRYRLVLDTSRIQQRAAQEDPLEARQPRPSGGGQDNMQQRERAVPRIAREDGDGGVQEARSIEQICIDDHGAEPSQGEAEDRGRLQEARDTLVAGPLAKVVSCLMPPQDRAGLLSRDVQELAIRGDVHEQRPGHLPDRLH
eukprot:765180-Hanusia_phi.AAC.2